MKGSRDPRYVLGRKINNVSVIHTKLMQVPHVPIVNKWAYLELDSFDCLSNLCPGVQECSFGTCVCIAAPLLCLGFDWRGLAVYILYETVRFIVSCMCNRIAVIVTVPNGGGSIVA